MDESSSSSSDEFDIRRAADLIEPAIFLFNKLGMFDLARQCILLHQFIFDTADLEDQLAGRADLIQKRTEEIKGWITLYREGGNI